MNDLVKQQLSQWNIRQVRLIGGELALDSEIATDLINLGYQVVRMSGDNRYATNKLINEAYFDGPTAIVGASGNDFPDALVSSVYAAIHNQPIVLLQPEKLDTITQTHLRDQPIEHVLLVGGEQAISELVAQQIRLIINGLD